MRKLLILPILLFVPLSLQAQEDEISTSQLTVIEREGAIVSFIPQIKAQKEVNKQDKTAFLQPSSRRKSLNFSKKEFYTLATAYSSSPDETDGSPFITASGIDIRTYPQRIVAANFLPFGTKLQLPDLYGDTIFEVQDRMHSRFYSRIDIWQPSKREAKQFGIRWVRVRIVE